jgi:hypothetical protein
VQLNYIATGDGAAIGYSACNAELYINEVYGFVKAGLDLEPGGSCTTKYGYSYVVAYTETGPKEFEAGNTAFTEGTRNPVYSYVFGEMGWAVFGVCVDNIHQNIESPSASICSVFEGGPKYTFGLGRGTITVKIASPSVIVPE